MPIQISESDFLDSYLASLGKLKKWLRQNKIPHTAFAESLGITKHTLSWIFHNRKEGRLFFSTEQAEKIESMTKRHILASDLLQHLVPKGYALVPDQAQSQPPESIDPPDAPDPSSQSPHAGLSERDTRMEQVLIPFNGAMG